MTNGNSRPALGTPRTVLCVGDMGRLRVAEISRTYLATTGVAPTLAAADSMVRDASEWRQWQSLLVDSRVGSDAEVLAYLERHRAGLSAAGTSVVLVLSALNGYLATQVGRFAHVANADDELESIALGLGLAPHPVRSGTGHVVVLSAKGGTGKTSAALALAEYLPRVRDGLKVTMVDMDLFDGNVAMSLGLAEKARSIVELAVAVSREGLTPQALQKYLTPTDFGIDVLAAPARSTYRSGLVEPGLIAQTYDALQALGRGMIVTDAPPDIRQSSPMASVFFDPARMRGLVCLLIVGPRKFERDGFERMVDYLRGQRALEHSWLVYMQTRPYRRDKDLDLMRGLDEMARKHGLRGVAGQLPFDPLVEDAEELGVPFWAVPPASFGQRVQWLLSGGSPFQRASAELARRVWQIVQEDLSRG
jgi:hypothetical protein